MIEVEHLTKDYGTVVAVRDVSFAVGKGEVVGFLGPNGAGKSTTLRILAGFLGATSGRVNINGFDVAERSLEARGSVGYMPEASPLYGELRVGEYLTFRAALKRVPRKQRKAAVARAMDQSAVSDMEKTLIGHLSKGYRQRVGLADALVGSPPLLILDEPTAGLDPNQIRDVRKLIRELGKEHTLLLSTHILSEVESVCDRALVIDRGKLVAEGTLEELRAHRRANAVWLTVRDPSERAAKLVSDVPGVHKARSERRDGDPGDVRHLRVAFGKKADSVAVIEQVVGKLVAAGLGVREVSPAKASLEEVFAQLTGSEREPTEEERE